MDAILDEAARRISWSCHGLDSYEWLLYYQSSENKDELRRKYDDLKKEFLGPYFKESDAWRTN